MVLEVIIMALGVVIIVLVMAFIVNPPEAWVKKFFHREPPPDSKTKRR